MTAKLITFPPSSDCENARWLLLRYGVDFKESAHAPPFFILASLLASGTTKIPIYKDKTTGLGLNGLPALFEHFDPLLDAEKRLCPDKHKTEIMQAWQLYNVKMGLNTVKWAYGYLLPHKAIMINPLSQGAPAWQQFFTRHFYFIPKHLLLALIKPTPESMQTSLEFIQTCFDDVNKQLADGRRYLIGKRFSLADMAFAVSGAPLVLPALGYGGDPTQAGPVPTFEQWPAPAQTVIKEMRESLAGQFILRLYAEERFTQ